VYHANISKATSPHLHNDRTKQKFVIFWTVFFSPPREGLATNLAGVDPDTLNAMMRAVESEMDNKEAEDIEYKNLFMEVSPTHGKGSK